MWRPMMAKIEIKNNNRTKGHIGVHQYLRTIHFNFANSIRYWSTLLSRIVIENSKVFKLVRFLNKDIDFCFKGTDGEVIHCKR